jgi:Tol biopolymer transport system component
MKRQVNFGVITLFASVLISCATGRTPVAAPMDPATLTPPPDSASTTSPMDPATLTPPPPDSTPTPSPEGTDFTATPRPPIPTPTRTVPTRTAFVTPTPPPPLDAIGTPGFDWEGPAIVYDGLKLSNYDGSQKKVIPIQVVISPWYSDYSPEAGRIVTTVDSALWTIEVGTGIQRRLSLNGSLNHYIESPVITSDGTKIAYSLVYGFEEEDIKQLWTINADGSENELVIDDTGPYITDPGPFRLIPFAWSLDNTRIYLVTTTDSEASPVGMYVADLIAGTIEKALTPQVTLWDVSFSPDRTRIAYRTFQWVPVKDSMPEIGPPFTLQVTDLTSGATRILQESDTLEYHYPVWSEDGNQIAFTMRTHQTGEDAGLFRIDLATDAIIRLVPGAEGRQLRPWLWLSDDRLVYTEEGTLYTIKNDGTDKHEIDSAGSVIGVLDN